ncbi:hypothetical protein [Roseovarius nanhaiticus]|uniref:hypothetical protein n=1 Tax=Roseovarius nanhaiticus TaxID=573024 RepID=UPI0024911969|nr:hypothetical protein [Roseovarius nanhaiticus]
MSLPNACEFANLHFNPFHSPLQDYLTKLHLFDGSNPNSKVTVCHIDSDGEWIPETISFKNLIQRTQEISYNNNEQDVYITQNVFRFGRKEQNADYINSFYIDIDYYKVPQHRHKSAEQVSMEAMRQLERLGLPEPTHVISSGRGLQLLWCIEKEKLTYHGNDVRKRWKALQKRLSGALESFGIDEGAKDISRVFRVVGTINSKNGALVRLIWQKSDGFYRYKFEDFANQVFGDTREEYHARRAERDRVKSEKQAQRNKNNVVDMKARKAARAKKRASEGKAVMNGLPISTIMDMRAEELIRLVKVRFANSHINEGQRNNFIFHIALAKSYVTQSSSLLQKMVKIAQMIAPDLTVKDIENSIYSVVKRAEKAENGQLIIWNGRKRDPRYRYSTGRIIQDLGITTKEMKEAGLVTLASPELKRRRKAARERQRREETLGARLKREARDAQNTQIWSLYQDGLSKTAIAKEMAMPRTTVRDRIKKLEETGVPAQEKAQSIEPVKTAATSPKRKGQAPKTSRPKIINLKAYISSKRKAGMTVDDDPPDPEFIPLFDDDSDKYKHTRVLANGEIPF